MIAAFAGLANDKGPNDKGMTKHKVGGGFGVCAWVKGRN
jgi:hypothetical protein